VKYAAEFQVLVGQYLAGSVFGESADADDPFRFEDVDDASQVIVTRLVESVSLGRGKFVRRSVAAGFLHEDERAVIGDEMATEEGFGFMPMIRDCAPEARAADLASRTCKAIDRSFRVFVRRSIDAFLDPDPVPYGIDFTKGHAGLGHAVGARVHAQKDDPLRTVGEAAQIAPESTPRMTQGIVDVGDRGTESNRIQAAREDVGGSNQAVCMTHVIFSSSVWVVGMGRDRSFGIRAGLDSTDCIGSRSVDWTAADLTVEAVREPTAEENQC